ncbi:MAG: GNAT family N-acetyltransferase [Clostridium sp.]|uniref:GNAT family N-acetyltransferase n=1 Tax=Clostridium sp. TaxID=1506 RepID=UPI003EE6CAE8
MTILKTPRLLLRPFLKFDLSHLHYIMSNKKIANLAGFKVKNTLNQTAKVLAIFLNEPPNTIWAITKDDNLIGYIELHNPTPFKENSKELGFILSEDYWGLHLMPEAINAIVDHSINSLDINTLICSHFKNNIQSQKAILKCDFKFIFEKDGKLFYKHK